MKLATFRSGGEDEIGIVKGEDVLSISRTMPRLASNMLDLIARWEKVEGEVRQLAEGKGDTLALSKVTLRAPIPRPGKILALGLNYADHIAETGAARPTDQTWFCKHTTAVNAPFAPIQIPKASHMIDYEVEMVTVIGKGGKHISNADARNRVFGYCVGNDVSTRDWQKRTPQWMLGKSFDSHAPFGPWITTADEIGDPHRLGVRCFVNGEKRQDSNTKHLIFKVWDQIEHLSKAMTLEPGDLLYTGTPGGVGMAMNPQQWLKPGDKVRTEIDELGAIEATCEAET